MTVGEMESVGALFQAFGPVASIMVLGFYAVRSLLPILGEYLREQADAVSRLTEAINRIADVADRLERSHNAMNERMSRMESRLEYIGLDITGIYERNLIPQPSREARPKAKS